MKMDLSSRWRMYEVLPASRSGVVMSLIVITVMVMLPLLCSAAPADDPECTVAYLDKCGKDIFLWSSDINEVKAPSNAEELKEHCDRQAASEDCVRKRSAKCHTNVVKGFSRLLYDAIHEEYEQRCDPESEYHTSYLRMAPCVSKMAPDMYNCTTLFIVATRSASESAHGKSLRERIPRACCSFATYAQCAESAARTICDEDTANFVKQYLERTSGELLSFACGSYTADTEVCKKFQAGLPAGPDEEIRKLADQVGVKTMLGALSTLTTSLQASRG